MGAKVMVTGTGGREHALGYGLNESPQVDKIYFANGNGGTARLSKGVNVSLEQEQIAPFVLQEKIDFVVIGPDAQVAAGLADELRAQGTLTFGASKAAARLEASKAFATEFMQQHAIPLPPSRVVADKDSALRAIEQFGGPGKSVIKADGLAAGKGVFLSETLPEATEALERILSGHIDGSGKRIVIQQRYHGPEVSIFVLSDGEKHQILPLASQDHKRLLVGDKGPNTGGMGVYAPLPDWMLNAGQWAKIADIADKTIAGMHAAGTPYEGVLYMGIMLAEELDGDPAIIEYNARWGDPETEVIIPLLIQNGVDVYEMLCATATGGSYVLPKRLKGVALTICLASAGYPDSPQTGETIEGLDKDYPDVLVLHGGTKQQGSELLTSGGRVLYVIGFGETLETASNAATAAIGKNGIHFPGMQYRPDIGHRAFKR